MASAASRRQKEIAELLRREISHVILRELSDPRRGFVTVTRVCVAGDYRSAKVYVTVRGGETDVRRTMQALVHARGHVQALVGGRLTLRWTPVLEFIEDRELVRALRVDKLLDRVSRERGQEPPQPPERSMELNESGEDAQEGRPCGPPGRS